MLVRVDDQQEDARVVRRGDGEAILVCRTGLLTTRAFMALVLTLAPVAATVEELPQSQEHLQHTG